LIPNLISLPLAVQAEYSIQQWVWRLYSQNVDFLPLPTQDHTKFGVYIFSSLAWEFWSISEWKNLWV